MPAGGSHCHTLLRVKIFVCKWSDQGRLCIGNRTRGTSCWVLTEYIGSLLTGNNTQQFWTGLLYLPESSSYYAMILPKTLACLILQEPLEKFLPIALFPHFAVFIASVCLPLGKMLSEPMLSEHGFGGDELPMLWLYQCKGTELLVLSCGLDVNNTLLTVSLFDCCRSCPWCPLMLILSTLALMHLLMLPHAGISIHTSFRWVWILQLQMCTVATVN